MVGRHDFDQIHTDLPACGHQGGLDYEQIIALHPTHILIEWGSRPLPPRLESLAAANHWTIKRTELRSLEDITTTADAFQKNYAPSDGDPPSTALEASWAKSTKPLESIGTVLLLGAISPPGALGPGSFHHEILVRLGGTPAFTAGAPWIQMDAEDIIALAPDAIILIAPRPQGTGIQAIGEQALPQLGPIGTLNIPASDNNRVAILDGLAYLTPSTAMADFARDLRAVLEQWSDRP